MTTQLKPLFTVNNMPVNSHYSQKTIGCKAIRQMYAKYDMLLWHLLGPAPIILLPPPPMSATTPRLPSISVLTHLLLWVSPGASDSQFTCTDYYLCKMHYRLQCTITPIGVHIMLNTLNISCVATCNRVRWEDRGQQSSFISSPPDDWDVCTPPTLDFWWSPMVHHSNHFISSNDDTVHFTFRKKGR